MYKTYSYVKCLKNHFAKFEIFIQKQGRIQELVQGAHVQKVELQKVELQKVEWQKVELQKVEQSKGRTIKR